MTTGDLPLPNEALAYRVSLQPINQYVQGGRDTRAGIISKLPPDWNWDSKRVLEFGCGAGRILRHFIDEANVSEFYGCDIDRPSIEWLEQHLVPPFHVFTNGERPPIDVPDGSFDLIYAVSVFTHLTDQWAPWLHELHRLLKPGGVLLSTFMGEGVWQPIRFQDEPWDEDKVGMLAHSLGNPWSIGGPSVLHSCWWVKARWSRLFDIEAIQPTGFRAPGYRPDHGYVLARKTTKRCTRAELEAVGNDPREIGALQRQVEVLFREGAADQSLRISGRDGVRAVIDAARRRARRLRR